MLNCTRSFLIAGILIVALLNCSATLWAQGLGYEFRLSAIEKLSNTESSVAVVVGDFDQNGLKDLISIRTDDLMAVHLSDCSGGFQSPLNFQIPASDTGERPSVSADFNNDSFLDVAILNHSESSLAILYGDGTGQFSTPVEFNTGGNPRWIETADMDADGYPDLVTSNLADDTLTVLLSSGSPGLEASTGGIAVSLDSIDWVRSIALADFNNDGLGDIAVASPANGLVAIHFSLEAGNFSAPITVDADYASIDIIAADLDKDGNADLVAARPAAGAGLRFYWGDGTGAFTTAVANETIDIQLDLPYSLWSEDIDGDNLTDLLISSSGDKMYHLRGVGSRSFVSAGAADVEYNINFVVDDIDHDGVKEIYLPDPVGIYPILGGVERIFITDQFFRAYEQLSPGSVLESGIGDFNGDGVLDLMAGQTGSLNLHFGVSDSSVPSGVSYGAPLEFSMNGYPEASAVCDVNSDGNDDYVILYDRNDGNSSAYTFRSGEISPISEVLIPERSQSLIVDDFNGDGHVDLIVGHSINAFNQPGFMSFLAGSSSGEFSSPTNIPDTYIGFPSGVSGDIDNDGLVDLVLLDPIGVSIRWGESSPTAGGVAFSSREVFPYEEVESVRVADMNADGNLDIVAITHQSRIRVMLGDGAGNFSTSTYPSSQSTIPPAVVDLLDLNNDGNKDVLMSTRARDVRVRLGSADGSLLPERLFKLRGIGGTVYSSNVFPILAQNGIVKELIVCMSLGSSGNGGSKLLRIRSIGPTTDCNANGIHDLCDGGVGCLKFVRGDANQDLSVDIADVISSLGHLFSAETALCLEAMDANSDQGVDIADSIFLLTHLFAMGVSPAPPFPMCGVNGLNSLGCDFPACP